MRVLIRTIKEFDLDEVCQHLLLAGDLSGDCFNCKQIGLDFSSVKNCPKCRTDFRFIASRKSDNFGTKILNLLHIHKKRPDLIYIEFNDLKQHKNREKARDFLS